MRIADWPWPRLLFWLTPPLLALGLYGPTLSLPFFWDDVANFQFMFGRPLWQIWIDSSGFPYYRPLTFSLWRMVQVLFGLQQPAPFHALSVLALVACGWLVGLLARQLAQALAARSGTPAEDLPQADLAAWLAAALLTAFPFAALVVPLVATLFHLAVTLLATGACLCILKFERSRRAVWAGAAAGLAALAPFAHESGMAAGLLMAVCIGVRFLPPRRGLASSSRGTVAAVGISLALNLAYVAWWSRVPKARTEGDFAWVGWESVGQSLVFFFEGLTFPVQFLARPLMAAGWNDLAAVTALGALGLAGAWAALRDRRWLFWGIAYCFAAAVPAIIALPFSYIIVSPRLMLFTAPAAAILWAAVAVEGARRVAPSGARVAVAACAVAVASAIPAGHIAREVRLHHQVLDHLWDYLQATRARPAERLLIVNPVNWVAPVRSTYALGHEGVQVMPGYLTPQLMAWVHTQALPPVDGVSFPLIFPHLEDIYFSTWGEALDWSAMAERVRQADRVAIVRYGDERIEYVEAGYVAAGGGEPVVSFADRIWLTQVEARVRDGAVDLRLSWRANAASSEDIFAHAFDCQGNVLGLADGAGLGGIYPIWLWQPGESVHEVRRIDLSRASPDGCYVIELGLFNPADGTRAEARQADGQRLENDALIVRLQSEIH